MRIGMWNTAAHLDFASEAPEKTRCTRFAGV
jgi:hypothetical protein